MLMSEKADVISNSCRRKGNIRLYILQIILGIFFSFLLYHLWNLQIKRTKVCRRL